jgi:hypothetical protein
MIKKLPKWAELSIASACAAGGAVAHRPDEDENGWDYLIEFEPEKHPGPADTHPPIKSAYVQVKSTTKRKLTSRIKLSNALKAAQAQQPWFVVLVIAIPNKPVETYAIHLWDKFMARALRNVRVAENEGWPLHSRTLSIRFDASDRHDDDLISWMQNIIGLYGSEYEQKKRKIFQSVGYEDSSGVGKTTIISSNFEDLVNNFLGLGDGLEISKFSFTPSRFGLVSRLPELDFTGSGKLVVTPNPIDACEMRLRALDASYVLKGDVYTLGMPLLAEKDRRVRFSAEFVELVVSPGVEVKTFNASIDPEKTNTLYVLEAFAALNAWCQKGIKPTLQVWARGARVIFGEMALSRNKPTIDWDAFVLALRVLRELAVGQEDTVKISLREALVDSRRLAVFTQAIKGPSFKLSVPLGSETQAEIDSLLFYSFAQVGAFLFYALCDSPLKNQIETDKGREIFFGPARIIDSYIITDPTPQQREQMKSDYEHHLRRLDKTGKPGGLGEILEFSSRSRALAADV